MWANLDETLQGKAGVLSDEHGGSDVELAPWVGVNILRNLDFVFYFIIEITIMTAFSPLDTSITQSTVLSVHQLMLTVWP